MQKEIKVWDILVRLFHWSLVITFFVSYITGDEDNELHIIAGYAVLGLILFRLLWGFIGTRYARFAEFVRSPRTVIGYLKSMTNDHPKRYIGHNPAGGWMIVAMLTTLLVVSVSGLKVYAIEEGLGPLASDTSITVISQAHADSDEHGEEHGDDEHEMEEEFWEEIHEASSNFMLLLIFLHIAGVFLSGVAHKENLVKAMFTGKKRLDVNDDV